MTPPVTIAGLGVAAVAVSVLALTMPGQASADSAGKQPPAKNSVAGSPMKASPMKGSGSGIAVQYRVDGTPEVGVAVPVVLKFDGVTDQAGASLRITTEGGLSMGAPPATTLPAGQVTTVTVNVMPAAAGVAYLHVFTTQYGATSATSIPIRVGKAPSAMPSTGEVKEDSAGEKILPMQVK